jgi:hypothetical protein
MEDRRQTPTTTWLFREALIDAHLVDKLFNRFGQHLQAKDCIARGGQIVDATIVSAPRQRNTKGVNEAIKTGETPKEWEKQPTKLAQKDVDAPGPRRTTTGSTDTRTTSGRHSVEIRGRSLRPHVRPIIAEAARHPHVV